MNIDNQYNGRLLDVTKASDYLGISPQSLKRLFYSSNQTSPVPTRLGHRLYFTPESLDQFVTDNTRSSGNEVK